MSTSWNDSNESTRKIESYSAEYEDDFEYRNIPRIQPAILKEIPLPDENEIFNGVQFDTHFLRANEEKNMEFMSTFGPEIFGHMKMNPSAIRAEQSSQDWQDWTKMTDAEFEKWADECFA